MTYEVKDESIAETMERSEMGTPFPDPPLPRQHSAADSGVTGAVAMIGTIAARRRKIREDAPCEYCGTTLAECRAWRGTDPTAPPWFGCCAHGLGAEPCAHRSDPAAMQDLLDEIEAGHVRTVEEASRPRTSVQMIGQSEWWQRKTGEWVRIAEMSAGHRYNTAAMLLRNNPPMSALVRGSTLYKALTAGLTIQGDGTEPWQKTGRDPATGEPCEVPPPTVRVCEIPDCGCSGKAHA
jgi:hypothetical protein